jgi:hypothetical protein
MHDLFSDTTRFVSTAMNALGIACLALLAAGVIALLPWTDDRRPGTQTIGSLLIGNAGALALESVVSSGVGYFPDQFPRRGEEQEEAAAPTF